jgi:hypothetical protein
MTSPPTTLTVDAPCMSKECAQRRQKPSTLNNVEYRQCVNKKTGRKSTWQALGQHDVCGGKVQAFISYQLAQTLGLEVEPAPKRQSKKRRLSSEAVVEQAPEPNVVVPQSE